jgi:hypothetical protein
MDQMLTDMAGLRTLRGEVSAMWMAAANNEMELVRTLAQVSPDVQNVRASPPRSCVRQRALRPAVCVRSRPRVASTSATEREPAVWRRATATRRCASRLFSATGT